jgi:hypothetical protein
MGLTGMCRISNIWHNESDPILYSGTVSNSDSFRNSWVLRDAPLLAKKTSRRQTANG